MLNTRGHFDILGVIVTIAALAAIFSSLFFARARSTYTLGIITLALVFLRGVQSLWFDIAAYREGQFHLPQPSQLPLIAAVCGVVFLLFLLLPFACTPSAPPAASILASRWLRTVKTPDSIRIEESYTHLMLRPLPNEDVLLAFLIEALSRAWEAGSPVAGSAIAIRREIALIALQWWRRSTPRTAFGKSDSQRIRDLARAIISK